MIYTSHQLGEVERLCDRITILDHGRNVAEGTLAELQRRDEVARRGAASLSFVDATEAQRAVEVLSATGVHCGIEEDLPDLEEIFLALTGHGLRDGGAQ